MSSQVQCPACNRYRAFQYSDFKRTAYIISIRVAGDDQGCSEWHIHSNFQRGTVNIGNHDLVLNLGMMLANGRQQYADSIHLILRDVQNSIKMLDLKGPPIVTGRVDPFVVPLPKGARIILPIDLAEYWVQKQHVFDIQLEPGQYFLTAEYRGERVNFVNSDMRGISRMPYWLGRVNSMETAFEVPDK